MEQNEFMSFDVIANMTDENRTAHRNTWDAVDAIRERYWSDDAFRARIDSGDVTDVLESIPFDVPPESSIRIVADSSERRHFIMPPDPNFALEDEQLSVVAGGGKTAGSAGSLGTASTLVCSSSPSSASSASSAGTVGTAS